MNILIVDDEPINILLLESLLKGKHNTRTAENGMLAYQKIEEEIPDIVLLDVLMPTMDGFETLKKIKSNKQFSNIAVIMVTAKVEKDDVRHALQLGADDYIKKPIDATELYTKIDIHFRIKQSNKQVLKYQVYANIHESMISAQRIQQSLLPDKSYFTKIFPNSFTLYKPRDMIGGDMYFVAQHMHEKFICVSDSTGHGVPAAMLSMLTYMGLDMLVKKQNILNPLEVAVRLSHELSSNLEQSEDTYVSSYDLDAVFCQFDFTKNTLNYTGIRRPLVLIRKNTNYLIVNGKKIKPFIHNESYYLFYIRGEFIISGEKLTPTSLTVNRIELQTNDVIYMYSDGITDQFGGPREKKFSKRRFLELLLSCQTSPLKFQKLKIYQNVEQWGMNIEQTDDMVVIGIKV